MVAATLLCVFRRRRWTGRARRRRAGRRSMGGPQGASRRTALAALRLHVQRPAWPTATASPGESRSLTACVALSMTATQWCMTWAVRRAAFERARFRPHKTPSWSGGRRPSTPLTTRYAVLLAVAVPLPHIRCVCPQQSTRGGHHSRFRWKVRNLVRCPQGHIKPCVLYFFRDIHRYRDYYSGERAGVRADEHTLVLYRE
ncbi:hypothetical protein BC628DRAFT_880519 [Trametes gibbosa]|nr:hypothetical protein BC628DRAFT_880519 [Trametes gibbosa]